jgi:uncharacterized protein
LILLKPKEKMSYDIILGRNESDKKKFKEKGLIKIGRTFVKMDQYTSLSNNLFLDVIRSHVILVAGKRGSGKSYTLGVLAEEIANLPKEVSQNIACLMFDTMGIYWTMKYQNQKDSKLLEEWELKPKSLPVKIFAPHAYFSNYAQKGIPVDEKFALDTTEMEPQDWILTFDLKITEPISILIQNTINKLKSQNKEYNIETIIEELEKNKTEERNIKNSAINLFQAAKDWGIFADKKTSPTKISDLINPGKTTVLDLSTYNSIGTFNIRALVINLVTKKIFNQRMQARKKEEIESIATNLSKSYEEKKEMPLVWIFIDEAHEFLPQGEKTLATDALVQLLREGRQPGISVVLATQQPGKIHTDVMTQSDIVISHRVTSSQDLEALNKIMQSYVLEGIKQQMDNLPSQKGSAIILDDNSERIYPMKIRPRFTWHGGEAPKAIQEEKELF